MLEAPPPPIIPTQSIVEESTPVSFWQRHRLATIGVVITIVLLIISAVLIWLTPATVPVGTRTQPVPEPSLSPQDNIEIPIVNISSSEVVVSIPEQLPIYENAAGVPDVYQIAQHFVDQFGLVSQSENGWAGAEHFLYLDPTANAILFSSKNPQFSNKTGFSDSKLITETRQQLQQLGLNPPDQQYLNFKIEYFISTDDLQPVDTADQANTAAVTITQKIDAIPLTQLGLTNAHSSILFNADYQLINLTYIPLLSPKPLFEMKTFSSAQALENIANGQYTIVSSYQEFGTPATLTSLENVTFESGQVEYRYFPDQNRIYPYFRFSGRGYEISPEFSYAIEVLTPAIETTPTTAQ